MATNTSRIVSNLWVYIYDRYVSPSSPGNYTYIPLVVSANKREVIRFTHPEKFIYIYYIGTGVTYTFSRYFRTACRIFVTSLATNGYTRVGDDGQECMRKIYIHVR